MKNLKRISLILLTVFLTVTASFGQDTVYFDTHTNTERSASFASQFSVDSVTTDTTYFSDTTENVWTINTTVTHNVPSTYSTYIVEMELIYKQGGFDYSVDTNSTPLTSNTASFMDVSGPITDTINIGGGSSVDYNIYNISNSGRYEVTSTIMHTIDTLFINSMSTSLFDKVTPKVEFTLYPNPTVNDINITFDNPTNENITFNIFDMSGRMVKQGNLFNNRIDVSNLNRGTYFINLNVANEIMTKKFMKN